MGRSGDGINFGPYKMQWTFPALDGSVSITFSFGAAMAHFPANLFRWIWEEGGCDKAKRDMPFAELTERLGSGDFPVGEVERLNRVIAAFTVTRTKAELFAEATRRRVLLAPIAVLDEVMENEHLAVRGYWDEVEHAGTGRAHRLPGRFVRSTVAPLAALGPAPQLGEHDALLEAMMQAPHAAPASWPVADLGGVPTAPQGPSKLEGTAVLESTAVLGGLKVLDLAWSVAGPLTGRTLADFGATVVRVESRDRPCVARTTGPFHPAGPVPPRIQRHVGRHQRREAGPGAGPIPPRGCRGGAGSGALGRRRGGELLGGVNAAHGPGLRAPGRGQPRSDPAVQLVAGPDRALAAAGPGQSGHGTVRVHQRHGLAGSDPVRTVRGLHRHRVPRFAVAAILAALEHRRRTGEGQHLDLSQAESSLHLLTPALLDAEVNGRNLQPRGNRDLTMAPHGTYPARGEDRWIAIACQDDDAWRALAACLGRPDLAGCPFPSAWIDTMSSTCCSLAGPPIRIPRSSKRSYRVTESRPIRCRAAGSVWPIRS